MCYASSVQTEDANAQDIRDIEIDILIVLNVATYLIVCHVYHNVATYIIMWRPLIKFGPAGNGNLRN